MDETPLDRIRNRQQRLEAKKHSGAGGVRKDGVRADASSAGAGAVAKAPAKALTRVADGMTVLDAKKARAAVVNAAGLLRRCR